MPYQNHHAPSHTASDHKLRTILNVLKGDVRHLPRVAVFSVLSVSVYNIGWGFADPFFSVYLATFAEQYSVIGFFKTLMVVVGIAILIPLGNLIDRVNHVSIMNRAKIVYFFIGLLYFLAGETGSTTLLVIALLLNGAMAPLIWDTTLATIQDYSNKKNADLISGFYMTARKLANAIGLAFGIWLVWKFPIHYIFIPIMIFPLLSMLFTRGIKPKRHEPFLSAVKNIIVEERLIVGWWNDIRKFTSEMRWVLSIFFLVVTIHIVSLVYLPLFAHYLGFTIVEIGILTLLMNIPFFLSFVFAEISDRIGRLRNVGIGILVSAASIGAMLVFNDHTWQLYLLSVSFAGGYAILIPSLTGLLTILTPKEETGTVSTSADLVVSISAMISAPIIGAVIDWVGWNGMFIATAVFLVGAAVFVFGLRAMFQRRNLVYHTDTGHKKDKYVI